ncbi:MAG: AAA family ATPase [Bacteroidales bacterium]|nr:AAA family ATPase [Bacteroidales bacterium]
MNLSLEDLAKELGSYYSNEELGKISGIQKFCYEYYPYIDGEYMSVNVTKLLELAGIPKDYNVEINKYVKFCHLFPKQDPTKITYEFVPQSFTKAYIRAWQTEEPVYLVIEEINRGNCAQIFGDLFQLLDRKNGVSEYPIKADNDLALYIAEKLSDSTRTDIPKLIKNGEELMLPSNLYIWATMNTSDQSLFPIDSAFKRRWEWKYVPIAQGYDKETGALLDWNIKIGNKTYNWWKFLQAINQHIGDITHSEDKKLGYFFCKAENDIISAETFVGKVLFYLWNDVYKDYDHSPAFFRDENGKLIEFSEYYKQDDKYNTIPNDTLIQTFIEKVEPAFKTIVADANTD